MKKHKIGSINTTVETVDILVEIIYHISLFLDSFNDLLSLSLVNKANFNYTMKNGNRIAQFFDQANIKALPNPLVTTSKYNVNTSKVARLKVIDGIVNNQQLQSFSNIKRLSVKTLTNNFQTTTIEKVEELKVKSFNTLTYKDINLLNNLKVLKLGVSYSIDLNKVNLNSLLTLQCHLVPINSQLNCFPNVTNLTLIYCKDQLNISHLTSLTKLNKLNISKNYIINVEEIKQLNALQCLNISNCTILNNESKTLCLPPSVTSLIMDSCNGIKKIGTNNLTNISLNRCVNFDLHCLNDDLQHLGVSFTNYNDSDLNFKNLKSLCVKGCINIDGSVISQLPNLVYLGGNSYLNDKDVIHLKNLETLALNDNTTVTAKALATLPKDNTRYINPDIIYVIAIFYNYPKDIFLSFALNKTIYEMIISD
ncbi:hypothetical protein ABK040_011042 [Willaertia magna]